jgi:molybdate transport system regulatory protein
MNDLEIRLRIDLAPGRALGPGKIALLEALDRTGSLAQAARELGMSYRRAWLLIQSVNALTDHPAVTATKGGSGGGGAVLTAHGRAMISAFHAVEVATRTAARQHFRKIGVAPATPADIDEAGIRRLPLATAVAEPRDAKRPARRGSTAKP